MKKALCRQAVRRKRCNVVWKCREHAELCVPPPQRAVSITWWQLFVVVDVVNVTSAGVQPAVVSNVTALLNYSSSLECSQHLLHPVPVCWFRCVCIARQYVLSVFSKKKIKRQLKHRTGCGLLTLNLRVKHNVNAPRCCWLIKVFLTCLWTFQLSIEDILNTVCS